MTVSNICKLLIASELFLAVPRVVAKEGNDQECFIPASLIEEYLLRRKELSLALDISLDKLGTPINTHDLEYRQIREILTTNVIVIGEALALFGDSIFNKHKVLGRLLVTVGALFVPGEYLTSVIRPSPYDEFKVEIEHADSYAGIIEIIENEINFLDSLYMQSKSKPELVCLEN